jgi:hypothetical protein
MRSNLILFGLIGLASGAAVSVTAAAFSGAPLFDPGGWPAPVEPSPELSATTAPLAPVASQLEKAPSPTPRPSTPGTMDPTASTTAQPTPVAATKPIVEATDVMLGLPGRGETAGTTTPVAALGEYITWTATVGAANFGMAFDVEVAARLQGRWTGWSKLTSRVADADGVVIFSWRQQASAWISVRFAHPALPSRALQGRWR